MRDVGIVRRFSGEWNRAQELLRLRIEADNLDQPQDIMVAPPELQSLIDLLLALSCDAGPRPQEEQEDISPRTRSVRTLPLDTLILSETDENGAVLEFNVGRVSLAFFLRANSCLSVGQTLTTLATSRGSLTQLN